MDNEEIGEEEIGDESMDEFEQGQDLSDEQLQSYETTSPQQRQETTAQYNWFWKVVGLNKPFRLAKVGNLSNPEIGEFGISMRDSMNLAHLGHLFGHHKFGNYFATKSKIVSATSMARRGWFMDLSISQKKVRERSKTSSASSENKQKWRLFKGKNQGQSSETPT